MPKETKEQEVIPKRTPIMRDEPAQPEQDAIPKPDPMAGMDPVRARFATWLESNTAPMRPELVVGLTTKAKKIAVITRVLETSGWDNPFKANMARLMSVIMETPVPTGTPQNPLGMHKGVVVVPLDTYNSHNYTVGQLVIVDGLNGQIIAGYRVNGTRGNDMHYVAPHGRMATREEIIEFAKNCDLPKIVSAMGLIII